MGVEKKVEKGIQTEVELGVETDLVSPEQVRLEVARRLYRRAISTYEALLQSKDPKILKDVAKDILEIAGGKEKDHKTGGSNVNIALFPPEYIAKVASSMKKLSIADITDVEFKEITDDRKRGKNRKAGAGVLPPKQLPTDS